MTHRPSQAQSLTETYDDADNDDAQSVSCNHATCDVRQYNVQTYNHIIIIIIIYNERLVAVVNSEMLLMLADKRVNQHSKHRLQCKGTFTATERMWRFCVRARFVNYLTFQDACTYRHFCIRTKALGSRQQPAAE